MSKRVVIFAAALTLLGSVAEPASAMPRAMFLFGGTPMIARVEPAAQHISARKRAWFRQTITRILAGDAGCR